MSTYIHDCKKCQFVETVTKEDPYHNTDFGPAPLKTFDLYVCRPPYRNNFSLLARDGDEPHEYACGELWIDKKGVQTWYGVRGFREEFERFLKEKGYID